MEQLLAQNDDFDVVCTYEMASLVRREGFFSRRRRSVLIGDFYGNPEAAAFSPDGALVVTVGCGLIVYRLREPFEEFRYDHASPQWAEAKRGWWISNVRWRDAKKFFFWVEPSIESEAVGRYQATVSGSDELHIEIERA